MNIFVAKLSSKTKSQDLEQLFSKFGEVTSAKIIVDRETGFSKLYGFVEMPDEQAAYKAIDKLNDTELDGSQIVVKISVSGKEKRNPM
jgi:RNA recognition motif-containing protein